MSHSSPVPAPLDRNETVFRFLAEPSSVNFGGKVHGGALMKWIDEVAYACAAVWSSRYCVTVSVGNIRFQRPILVGNLVELKARVVATGRTSMHIHVSVHAGDPKGGVLRQTTDCLVVFVAVDENGNPLQAAREIRDGRARGTRQDRRDEAGRGREGRSVTTRGRVRPRLHCAARADAQRVPTICSGLTHSSNSASVR